MQLEIEANSALHPRREDRRKKSKMGGQMWFAVMYGYTIVLCNFSTVYGKSLGLWTLSFIPKEKVEMVWSMEELRRAKIATVKLIVISQLLLQYPCNKGLFTCDFYPKQATSLSAILREKVLWKCTKITGIQLWHYAVKWNVKYIHLDEL